MIFVVSSNPLFKEVILQATAPSLRSQCFAIDPDEARSRICELCPGTILIDDSIPAPLFDAILSAARSLPQARTIVLNPQQNEILLLDSRRASIHKVDELLEVMTINDP